MHATATIVLRYADGRPHQILTTTSYTVVAEPGGLLRVLDDQRRVYLGVKSITTIAPTTTG